jgi:hypothetical protein
MGGSVIGVTTDEFHGWRIGRGVQRDLEEEGAGGDIWGEEENRVRSRC